MSAFVGLSGGVKPSLVVGDVTRPTMRDAYLCERDGKWELVATDSYRLVRIPVEVDADELPSEGWIPRAALEAAERVGGFRVLGDQVEVSLEPEGLGRFDRPVRDRPQWADYTPNGHRGDEFSIAVNAEFVREVMRALGSRQDVIVLTFHPETPLTAIGVRPLHRKGDDEPTGWLMPMRESA